MEKRVSLIITTRSNYQCPHCLRGLGQPNQDISLDLLSEVLPQARSLGIDHVALTGGEAALHPQFDQLVEMIVDVGFTWSVVTNGAHPEWYQTSIDRYGERLTMLSRQHGWRQRGNQRCSPHARRF